MAANEQEELELLRLRKQKALAQQSNKKDEEPSLGEKAKAFAYGAATGLGGGLGELEKFGAYTVPKALGFETPKEEKTIFPTGQDVEGWMNKAGIQKPREEVGGYQTAGDIIGGFGAAIPGFIKGGAKALIGHPTQTREAAAQAAEKLGFKLSPAQVRADLPLPTQGATGFAEHNQSIANKLASKATGVEAAEISPEFVRNRLRSLGNEFDKVYKGKQFKIDQGAVDALRDIAAFEQQLPTGIAKAGVKSTAGDIVSAYDNLTKSGKVAGDFKIDGEALQRIRNSLTEKARSTSNAEAHNIYEMVDKIDESIARHHPDVAAKLTELRPKYRNTIILDDLMRQGGIQGGDISLERLGTMLSKRGGSRTMTPKDLDHLGEIGKTSGIRAQWQPSARASAEAQGVLGKALGTGADVMRPITGSRSARALQRSGIAAPKNPLTRFPEATAVGNAVSPIQQDQ